MQRRLLLIVARLHIGALGAQIVDDDRLPGLRGIVDRLQTGRVARVHVDARLERGHRAAQIATERRKVQHRLLLVRGQCARARSAFGARQNELHHLGVLGEGGPVQRVLPIVGIGVREVGAEILDQHAQQPEVRVVRRIQGRLRRAHLPTLDLKAHYVAHQIERHVLRIGDHVAHVRLQARRIRDRLGVVEARQDFAHQRLLPHHGGQCVRVADLQHTVGTDMKRCVRGGRCGRCGRSGRCGHQSARVEIDVDFRNGGDSNGRCNWCR